MICPMVPVQPDPKVYGVDLRSPDHDGHRCQIHRTLAHPGVVDERNRAGERGGRAVSSSGGGRCYNEHDDDGDRCERANEKHEEPPNVEVIRQVSSASSGRLRTMSGDCPRFLLVVLLPQRGQLLG